MSAGGLGIDPTKPSSARSSSSTKTSTARTGLSSPIQSSRHSGNSGGGLTATHPSTKRLDRSSRKSQWRIHRESKQGRCAVRFYTGWVTSDRVESAAGPAMSASHPKRPSAEKMRSVVKDESPGGISPPGAPKTVREPLDSHGSRCSTVGKRAAGLYASSTGSSLCRQLASVGRWSRLNNAAPSVQLPLQSRLRPYYEPLRSLCSASVLSRPRGFSRL